MLLYYAKGHFQKKSISFPQLYFVNDIKLHFEYSIFLKPSKEYPDDRTFLSALKVRTTDMINAYLI